MNMKKTFTIGGVHPDENKLTATKPICELGLPKQAVYPLSQHIGAPSVPCVGLHASRFGCGCIYAEHRQQKHHAQKQ
mgnify:CR=1 FL=1